MASAVVIKKKKVDDPKPGQSAKNEEETKAEIKERMLALFREFPKGINNKILETNMPNVGQQTKADIVNGLLIQVKVLMELFFH